MVGDIELGKMVGSVVRKKRPIYSQANFKA